MGTTTGVYQRWKWATLFLLKPQPGNKFFTFLCTVWSHWLCCWNILPGMQHNRRTAEGSASCVCHWQWASPAEHLCFSVSVSIVEQKLYHFLQGQFQFMLAAHSMCCAVPHQCIYFLCLEQRLQTQCFLEGSCCDRIIMGKVMEILCLLGGIWKLDRLICLLIICVLCYEFYLLLQVLHSITVCTVMWHANLLTSTYVIWPNAYFKVLVNTPPMTCAF